MAHYEPLHGSKHSSGKAVHYGPLHGTQEGHSEHYPPLTGEAKKGQAAKKCSSCGHSPCTCSEYD